jgi:UDP-glucose 4-epimerase
MRKVLVTGIAGGQGGVVAHHLLARNGSYTVHGVDREPWAECPREIGMSVADMRKRKLEDVIRKQRPDTIVHLAFIRHFGVHPALRHEVNVNGTRRLLEFAVTHGVEQVVICSSSYVYGALPENPYYMDESYPLNVSRTYPEVRDLTEVDMLASAFLWRHPETVITLLRPVSVLGGRVRNAIVRYLRHDYVPTVLGFDPMVQVIHEEDVAEAIALAIEKRARGIFNLVGPGAVPLHVVISETGGTPVPLPESLLRPVIDGLFRSGLYPLPPGAMDFAKYQCTLDGSRFVAATGFAARHSLAETFSAVRRPVETVRPIDRPGRSSGIRR